MTEILNSKTIWASFVMLIVGLAGTIDPSAANLVADFLTQAGIPVNAATILIFCSFVMAVLRKYTTEPLTKN